MKEVFYHSKLTVEQVLKNIEVFSREYGLPDAFFKPNKVFGSRRITEKPVDHREELYFVITEKDGNHIKAFIGSRNYQSKKLDITVTDDGNGSEIRIISTTGMLPIWFILMLFLTGGLFLFFSVGLFFEASIGSGVLICGLILFVMFAVYTKRAIHQIFGYYKQCDDYLHSNIAQRVCDRLLYSDLGEKTKDRLERDLRREVRSDEWRCPNCGSVNSSYVGTCGCGYIKREKQSTN